MNYHPIQIAQVAAERRRDLERRARRERLRTMARHPAGRARTVVRLALTPRLAGGAR